MRLGYLLLTFNLVGTPANHSIGQDNNPACWTFASLFTNTRFDTPIRLWVYMGLGILHRPNRCIRLAFCIIGLRGSGLDRAWHLEEFYSVLAVSSIGMECGTDR